MKIATKNSTQIIDTSNAFDDIEKLNRFDYTVRNIVKLSKSVLKEAQSVDDNDSARGLEISMEEAIKLNDRLAKAAEKLAKSDYEENFPQPKIQRGSMTIKKGTQGEAGLKNLPKMVTRATSYMLMAAKHLDNHMNDDAEVDELRAVYVNASNASSFCEAVIAMITYLSESTDAFPSESD